jgi:hypothetical protein
MQKADEAMDEILGGDIEWKVLHILFQVSYLWLLLLVL